MQNCGKIDDAQLAGGHRSRCGIHAARRCSAVLPSSRHKCWRDWLHWLHRLPTTCRTALYDAIRHFFRSHWKVILAMLVAILLATLTVDARVNENRACVARFFCARDLWQVTSTPSCPCQCGGCRPALVFANTRLPLVAWSVTRSNIRDDAKCANGAADVGHSAALKRVLDAHS
jgi:hypothetical protein